jgi:AcrR family transcriptional regulator
MVTNRRPRKTETPDRRILASALQEFSTYGFAGARMDRIALRARISKRMLFYYFKSKANLFEIILREAIQPGRTREPQEDDAFGTAPFWSSFHLHHPAYARLLGWEGLEFKKSNLPRLKRRRAALAVRLKRLEASFGRWNWPEDLDPFYLMFGLIAVELAPVLLPNLAYTLLGEDVNSQAFRNKWVSLVRTLAASVTAKRAPRNRPDPASPG